MTKKFFRISVRFLLISFVLVTSFFWANVSLAAKIPLSGMSNTFERLKVSEFSNQTVQFTSTSGVINGDMMSIIYPTGEFGGIGGKGTLGQDDVEVKNITTGHVYIDDSAGCSGEEIYIQVGASTINMFFCAGAGGFVSAGDVIRIYVGAFTTETVEDGDFKLINPAVAGTKVISLYTGPNGLGLTFDGGTLAVPIVDSDQVIVTANIDAILTFDLDTYATATAFPTYTETAAPYLVDLGSLSISGITSSNGAGGINSIWVDLSSNAVSGVVVTSLATGGPGTDPGLYSAATGKTITSASGPLMSGWEGYGICVANVIDDGSVLTWGGAYGGAGDFDGCDYALDHTVGIAQDNLARIVLHSSYGPIANGRAEILVKASAAATTPAASDYTDTLTFIATSTF